MEKEKYPALIVENVKKTYASGTEALKEVSLVIPEGDFFAFLGPNGAGKTTIIGIITGLVEKTSGSILVFGHDIDREPEKAKACIGVVPQEINFNIFETPLEIIVNQAGYYGISRKKAIPRAESLLRSLGIFDKKDQESRALSGGMKRRLMIARALIHKPRLLILDEPTAGVDVDLRRSMWNFLQSMTEKEGVTILLTTHYLEEAEQLCEHVAIIHQGAIIESGSMNDVLGKLNTESLVVSFPVSVTSDIVSMLGSYHAKQVDEKMIEIETDAEHGLNTAILLLNEKGFPISGIRNKTGRLEEVFVKLTGSKENL
jgi:ABC-2 type transport system ATP-binding protein